MSTEALVVEEAVVVDLRCSLEVVAEEGLHCWVVAVEVVHSCLEEVEAEHSLVKESLA